MNQRRIVTHSGALAPHYYSSSMDCLIQVNNKIKFLIIFLIKRLIEIILFLDIQE